MGVSAVFLIGTTGATAAHVVTRSGADPSVSSGALVFQLANGSGAIVRGGKISADSGVGSEMAA